MDASRAEDADTVSSLVKEYSERTSLRAFGVLICEEVDDRLLRLVKGLTGVEVVCINKKMISV